jgi:DNA-binding CsgD family transcriptional regulator
MNGIKTIFRLIILTSIILTTIPTFSADRNGEIDSLILAGVKAMFSRDALIAHENLTKAYNLAVASGLTKQQFLAQNNLALNYFRLLDYGNAISTFLKAYELALLRKDPIDEMTVLNNIAIVYIKENDSKKASEFLLRSYEIARREKIKVKEGLYASNLAQVYLESNDTIKSLQYAKIALENESTDLQSRINAEMVEASLLLQKGDIKQAEERIRALKAEAQLNNYKEELSELTLLLARLLSDKNDFPESRKEAYESLSLALDNEFRLRVYQFLSSLSIKQGLLSQAIAEKDSVIKITERINLAKNHQLFEFSRLRFELASSEHQLELSKTKSQSQQLLFIVLIASVVLLMGSIIMFFFRRAKRNSFKKAYAEKELRIKELELENEKIQSALLRNQLTESELLKELEIEKEKDQQRALKIEIEEKNKQLSDKILFQSTRNELIEEIVTRISTLPEIASHKKLWEDIVELKNHLKQDMKWDEILSHFESVNNQRLLHLTQKHPSLTPNDIRYLSFLYLNLSNKEIAALLNISPESCRKRKERIIVKLELEKNETLQSYLSSIS